MIVRQWKGRTRTVQRASYLKYLEATGLKEYASTTGNRGVLVLTREVEDTTEFVLLSFWESMEAVCRFAGPEPHRAVFYPEDDRFLVARDLSVSHHELAVDGREPARGAVEADSGAKGR